MLNWAGISWTTQNPCKQYKIKYSTKSTLQPAVPFSNLNLGRLVKLSGEQVPDFSPCVLKYMKFPQKKHQFMKFLQNVAALRSITGVFVISLVNVVARFTLWQLQISDYSLIWNVSRQRKLNLERWAEPGNRAFCFESGGKSMCPTNVALASIREGETDSRIDP